MSNKDRVVLDANVLYSAFLRDVLLSLFAAKLYEAKWTDEINAEWVEHLLENSAKKGNESVERSRIERTVQLMNQINPSPLVGDYEHIIAQLQLPDPNDRHVLAAAIAAEANKIVTWNLKEFPQQIVEGFGIAVQSPDDFVAGLIEIDPETVVSVLHDMRVRLKRPLMDVHAMLEALERNGLGKTRRLLERFESSL
jgi:predicted nucleic acid-binding protein